MVIALTAAVIFEGVVVDQRSAWDDGLIVSHSTLEAADGRRVEVRHLGGAIDGIGQIAWGDAAMAVGERVRVALEARGDAWVVAGGAAGISYPGQYVRTVTQCGANPDLGLSWDRAVVPFVLDAAGSDDLAPAVAHAAIRASFQTWEDVGCAYLAFRDDGTMVDAPIGFDSDGPNLNVLAWIESDWPISSTAFANSIVTYTCDTGFLLDADVTFNGEHHTFTAPDPAAGEVDVQNTATHEIGHVVGFDHSPDEDSTMFSTAAVGETVRRDLTADDAQGLCDVYPADDVPPDAGAPDPGPDAAAPVDGGDDEGGGCGCRAGADPSGVALVLLALALSVARRGRRGCPGTSARPSAAPCRAPDRAPTGRAPAPRPSARAPRRSWYR